MTDIKVTVFLLYLDAPIFRNYGKLLMEVTDILPNVCT